MFNTYKKIKRIDMQSNEELWVDPQGNLVHVGNIRDTDKLEHELVYELIEKAKKIRDENEKFKHEVFGDIDAFIELCRERYKVNLMSRTKKGNYALRSFDGKIKITITNPSKLELDHKVMMAKEKIDEFLLKELEGASAFLKNLVTNAFRVNEEGNLNVREVLKLKKIETQEPLWNEAMKIIDDSLRVVMSKTSVRFYERGGDNRYYLLDMDFSRIGVK